MKKQNLFCAFLFCNLVYFFISCQKDSLRGNNLKENKPPVANAGNDTVILLPVDSMTLDGSNSADPDGTIAKYVWSKISGPSSVIIANSQSAVSKISGLVNGSYEFELEVTDDGGLTASDTINIKVNTLPVNNQPPIANAGPDQVITLPTNSVALDGSQSSDPDSNISKYQWTKISGPSSVNILSENNVQTEVTSFLNGIYDFELKVMDAGGLTASDTIRVTVTAPDGTEMCDQRPVIHVRLVPIATLSQGRMNLKAAAAGNKLLFAGGFADAPVGPSTRVDIFDLATNSHSTAELSEVSGSARYDFAVTSCGNKILFGGGLLSLYDIDDSQTSIVDIYDASSNSWTVADLSSPRYNIAATSNGDIAIFAGGTSVINYPGYSWSTSNVVDIYDGRTNSWSKTTLSEARGKLSATSAGNKIYFAGGVKTLNGGSFLSLSNTIDVFDVESSSWSTATNLNEAKAGMASIAVGNKIWWGGGIISGSPGQFIESSRVEIRDLNNGSSSFACMIPRSEFTAVIKDDNIVFFTAEQFPRDGAHFDIYNIATDTWYTGTLDQYIGNAAIISVNNIIYVAGGTDGNGGILDKVWRLEF